MKIKEIYKYSFILAFRNILGSVASVIFLAAVLVCSIFVIPYMMYAIPVILIVLAYLAVYVHMGKVFGKYVFLETKGY